MSLLKFFFVSPLLGAIEGLVDARQSVGPVCRVQSMRMDQLSIGKSKKKRQKFPQMFFFAECCSGQPDASDCATRAGLCRARRRTGGWRHVSVQEIPQGWSALCGFGSSPQQTNDLQRFTRRLEYDNIQDSSIQSDEL